MRFFSLTALLLLTALPAAARDWGGGKETEVGCEALVEGQVLVDGPCTALLYKGGDFEVSQANGRVFIGVEITGKGVGKAHYRELNDGVATVEDLGPVRREKFDPACWMGERARVCAR